MKILVTGADGFLGNNIIRELLVRKYDVKVFLQKNRPDTFNELKIEKYTGDILEPESIIEASQDCDFIIHTAANTSVWPSKSKIVREVNIKGTQNIVNASLKNKIKRLVYIGTANSFGFGTINNLGNETKEFNSQKYGLDYITSKYEAQQFVIDSVKNKGLNAIILNPTFMIGPFDFKPTNRSLLLALINGALPGYSKGGRNFLHIKDAAFATCNALEKGKIGECYILGNENLTYKEFYKIAATQLKTKRPKLLIPKPFILFYGLLSETIAFITKKEPTLSYKMSKISIDTNFFSSEKAVKELGLPQTPIATAIDDAVDWFKSNNVIN
ncbi:MAG: NAD-dependent epimerase/dehydratase family protein [Bacteroidota bacterium]|nr:NAD-dependent epimerase/dehydratase family protein [Bacteroidota bacterium]